MCMMSLVLNVDVLLEKGLVEAVSISQLFYALEVFSHFGQIPELLTSNHKLQEWNKPHQRKPPQLYQSIS